MPKLILTSEIERLSRLEMLLENMLRDIKLLKDGSLYGDFAGDKIGEFRGCDGMTFLLDKLENRIALFTKQFFIGMGTAQLTYYDTNGNRIGSFGLDDKGTFFIKEIKPNGEQLNFLACELGFAFRDQNGRWGKVEVDTSNYLRYIPF